MALRETRNSLGVRVDAAHFANETTIITKNGSPRAVIVSYETFQLLQRGAVDHSAGADLGQTDENSLSNRSESDPSETGSDQQQQSQSIES